MIETNTALLVIDMQNDFVPGGALAVNGGNEILNGINYLITESFKKGVIIVFTQDWHPPGHKSFASAHKGYKPGDIYSEEGIGPVLWPDHCVQGTKGSDFVDGLLVSKGSLILRKGMNQNIDSYSAFLENDKKTETGLRGYLQTRGIKKVMIVGLATDYCCYYSAIDAKSFGFDVIFVKDLTRGVNIPANNVSNSLNDMKNREILIVNLEQLK